MSEELAKRLHSCMISGPYGSAPVIHEAITALEALAARVVALEAALSDLLQVNDGVPMYGMEATRRIDAARAALHPAPVSAANDGDTA